jgi:hypothetical protein
MKWTFSLVIVVAALCWASVGRADITGYNCDSDGDGAVDCALTGWAENVEGTSDYGMTIEGNQFWGPGHMNGAFTTDTDLDPTVRVRNIIDNDTGFAWTGYHIDVAMNNPFTLDLAQVYDPIGWAAHVTAPALVGGKWVGKIDYTPGTPIAVGDSLDFGYRISFVGLTSYTYCQTMSPVPEPGTMALLLAGFAIAGLAIARRRHA